MAEITEIIEEMQEVLGSWEAPKQGDDPGLTMEEWAKEWGLSRDATRKRLHQLRDAGLLIFGRRRITTIIGSPYRAPVYRAKT